MKTPRRSNRRTTTYTLQALAAAAGLPPRTVRYYIAYGLLDGPVKSGRGAHYTAAHLARLRLIQRRQRQGASLAEIRAALTCAAPTVPAVVWRHFQLAEDVTVLLRDGMPPWRAHLVLRHLEALARVLHTASSDNSHTTSHPNKEHP